MARLEAVTPAARRALFGRLTAWPQAYRELCWVRPAAFGIAASPTDMNSLTELTRITEIDRFPRGFGHSLRRYQNSITADKFNYPRF